MSDLKKLKKYPAWVKCPCCENFFCSIHKVHAHDCSCPPIEEWGKTDPYSEGGQKITLLPRPRRLFGR